MRPFNRNEWFLNFCILKYKYTTCVIVELFLGFSPKSSCKSKIICHQRHSFCVNTAQHCIFKKRYQIVFGSFLNSFYCFLAVSKRFHFFFLRCVFFFHYLLSYFTNQSGKRKTRHDKLEANLILSNFFQGCKARFISTPSLFCSDFFRMILNVNIPSWRFSSCTLSGGLFYPCHAGRSILKDQILTILATILED